MRDIYILGYNNLGVQFWNEHLELQQGNRLLFFRDGKSLLSNLKNNPTLIIIDEYFSEEFEVTDHNFSDMIVALSICAPAIPTFYVSPQFLHRSSKSYNYDHYFGSFNEELIFHMNKKIAQGTREEEAA